MASLAELMVRVGADISEFTRNMQQVDRTMTSTGQGLMKTGKSISDTGAKMGLAITTPLLALGTTAVVIGAKFDSEMSRVQAVTGATGQQFDAMRQQAIKLGADTAWSSSESAQAMYQLASAGFSVDEIMKTVPSVLSLASAGGLDLATSADIASSALRGFQLPVTQAQHVMDVLAKTASASNAEVSGLGESFKYVAPIAGTLGLSIEDVSAMLGEMANQGIKASQAGTSMRAGLLRMTKPTKQATAVMKEYGLSFFDAQGHMKTLPDIINNLQQGFKGLTDQQKLSALATLFGQEAVSGWSAVINQGGDNLKKFSNELKNSDGSAKKMADTMTNNLNGAWLNLTGSLESLAISFADVMKGDLQALAGKIADLVNWFTQLDPSVKKIIVVVGLLVAGIAPLLTVIGFVAQGFGALSIAFGAISAPVLAVIAVVTLLVVLFRDQIANLFKQAMTWVKPIRDALTYMNGGFNESIIQAQHMGFGIEDVIGTKALAVANILTTLKTNILNIWNEIVTLVAPILNSFKALVGDVVRSIVAFWEKYGAEILAKVQATWSSILAIVQPLLENIAQFINSKLQQIKAFWDENGTMIMTAVKNIFEFILSIVQFIMPVVGWIVEEVWGNIKGVIDGALNIIMGLLKVFGGLFTGNWSKVWEGIKQILGGAIEAVWNAINLLFIGKILKGFKLFIDGGIALFKAFGESLLGLFKGSWEGIWKLLQSFLNAIGELFTILRQHGESTFSAFKQVLIAIWDGIKTGVMDAVNFIKDGIVNRFNSIVSTVKGIFNTVKDAITHPIQTAKSIIEGIINDIMGAFRNMHIEIPKPKLPHVSVSMGTGVMGIPYPKFNVTWNARGRFFDQATILGNQGVGEAGTEAVLPLSNKRYMAPFAKAVSDNLAQMNKGDSEGNVENHFHFAEGAFVVREEADIEKIAQALYDKQKRTNRRNGL